MSRFTLVVALVALASSTASASLLINDNYSTYANGNLVGQNGWTQFGASATSPIQVSGGKVVIPGVGLGGTDNQDAYNTFPTVSPPGVGTTSTYVGMDITITSAVTNPAFIFAMTDTPAGFANERVTAKDNGNGTYDFGGRVTGQAGYPFVYGTAGLSYNTPYTLVLQVDMVAGVQNDVIKAWINPLLPTDPVYFTETYTTGTGTDPVGLGVVILSQFSNATTGQDGALISGLRVATTFAEAVPEPSTIALLCIGGLIMARRRK